MFTSSTELQNRSFHVMERARTAEKCTELKKAHAKQAKRLFVFFNNIWKFGTFLSQSLLCLPQLRIVRVGVGQEHTLQLCYLILVSLVLFSVVKLILWHNDNNYCHSFNIVSSNCKSNNCTQSCLGEKLHTFLL